MIERLRVLVVEDNPADVDLIREYMADSGLIRFQIDSVSCLSEAIARLERESFDLLLIDLGLPDSRGLITFDNLRKAAPNTPTIILTGYDDEETAIAAVRNGAQDYLIKGEIIGNLLIRVAQYAMERKRAETLVGTTLQRLNKLISNLYAGILYVSESGQVEHINQAFCDLFDLTEDPTALLGLTSPEMLKKTMGLYASPELELARNQEIIAQGKPVRGEEVAVRDGRTYLQDFIPIEADGHKLGRIWHFQDITERKKTEDKLRETLSGLRNALGGIIQVLSATTEKRDPYTAGHQRRAADLARAIGQEMGLAADRVEGLRTAGSIHDIGKVSIPAEILSKPTRLTEIEYKLIQSHSQVGRDILRDVDFSWPLAEMVFQHHERMNGSGYPQGLKGEDILLEARILAVSDVVEAMASHRPYRPSLGIVMALEEIEKNMGILYDPDVASTCLTLFREKEFTLKQ